jgi:hypothetical protein
MHGKSWSAEYLWLRVFRCPEKDLIEENCKPFVSKFERAHSTPVKVGKDWIMRQTDVVIGDHIKTVTANDEAHMMQVINDVMSTDLDGFYGVRPLWSIVRIENKGTGVSGLLIRVHHVIGDGIALVEALRNMFQDDKGNTLVVELPERVRGDRGQGMLATAWKFLTATVEVLMLANTPYDTNISFSAANKTQLSSPMGKHKSLIFRTLRLDFVKELKNKAKCTINDVYMCALSGAIRRYCERKGDSAVVNNMKIQCRVLMPVAFPRSPKELADEYRALRNKWYVCLFLCLGLHF